MPKTKISEFSATPANNTDIDSINIAEGCAPSGINDAIRELMAQLKDFQTGAVGDSFNGPVGTSTAAAGAFTTLAASGAVTLSGGTANGVAYLNGSKVVTSGSALTFDGTKLTSSASGAISGVFNRNTSSGATLDIQVVGGSVGTLGSDSGGNGRFDIAAGTSLQLRATGASGFISFDANNSEAMRLTSTGLGIGTSSPSVKLDVRSGATPTAALLDTTAATAYSGGSFFSGANLIIRSGANATGNGSGIRFASSNNGSLEGMFGWVQNASTYGDFVWQGYNGSYAERMRLDSSGNLGLGVTPSAWAASQNAFQIGNAGGINSSNSSQVILSANRYYANSGDRYINTAFASLYQQVSGQHQFYNAPSGTAGNAITFTQAMTLDASGNFILGATSASGRARIVAAASTDCGLVLDTSTNNYASFISLNALNDNGAIYNYIRSQVSGGTEHWKIGGGATASTMAFSTGGTERCRIDSSGNLLVGTTTSSVATNQGIVLDPTSGFLANNSTTESFISLVLLYSSHSTADQTKFEVTSAGDVKSRTNSYSGFSDVRLKQGITPASSQWNDIKNIEVVKFQMKSEQFSDAENPWMLGVIAQQVEQVSPKLVDEDAKDGMKTVKYSILYMKAVKALQEAMTRIEQLEARLDAANL